jgi:hypothetical protein
MTDKITMARLEEMVGAGVPCVRMRPDEEARLVQELRSYRTAAHPLQSVVDRFAGVKVKPLVWSGPEGDEGSDHIADTVAGRYLICQSREHGGKFRLLLSYASGSNLYQTQLLDGATLAEAKAAAQADYERRILSALETTPAPVSEINEEMVERVMSWVRDDVLPAYGITHTPDPEMVEGCRAALTAAIGGE